MLGDARFFQPFVHDEVKGGGNDMGMFPQSYKPASPPDAWDGMHASNSARFSGSSEKA